MTERENLIAARALIDTPEKWIKGQGHLTRRKWLFFEQHCYCTIGAISVQPSSLQVNSTPAFFRMREALENALPAKFKNSFLVAFNDHPDTTHADIMALFQRAIDAQPVSP